MSLVVPIKMGKCKQEIVLSKSLDCPEIISTTTFVDVHRKGRTIIVFNRSSQLVQIVNITIDKHTVQRRSRDDDVINNGIKILIEWNDLFPILSKKIPFDNLDLIAVYFKFDTLSVETS